MMYDSLSLATKNDININTISKNKDNDSTLSIYIRIIFGFISLVFIAAIILKVHNGLNQQQYPYDLKMKSSSLPELSITIGASNEYGNFSAPYPWLSDNTVLVEPYKTSTLTVTSDNDIMTLLTFDWNVQINDQGLIQSVRGNNVNFEFTSTGIFEMNITVTDDSGEFVGLYNFIAICKYVKRELRSLTTDDRERFLDAAAMIWAYSTEEGREIYGEKFTGIDSFVAIHMNSSNHIMCDSYHEGSGFLSHHLALSNSFDASLRAIDPSVTLPYWYVKTLLFAIFSDYLSHSLISLHYIQPSIDPTHHTQSGTSQ